MKQRWFFSLCALAYMSAPMVALAEFPGQIIVLGDSLSDSGNLPQINVLLPSPPLPVPVELILQHSAPETDGTTWAVWLADELKSSRLFPSSQAGTNFAVAGALTNGIAPLSPTIPSLAQQVTQIVPQVNRDYPVFVWGGGNDLLEINPLPPTAGTTAAGNIANILQSLHDEGFETLIAFNLPNLGEVPFTFSPGKDSAAITAQSLVFNQVLPQDLAELDFPVLGIDINALFLDVLANPHAYGFTNVTDATPATVVDLAGNVINPGSPTDGFLFFYDGEHPTHKAHLTIADYVYTTLRAPSFFGDLSQKSFSVSRAIMTNIRQQTFAVQPCHDCGVVYPFVNGSYEPLLAPPNVPHSKNRTSMGGDVTYGFTYDIGHTWRVGICGSYAREYFKNGERLTSTNTYMSTNAASIFGSYQDCNGYMNAAFTTSWQDFYKIKRFFTTGFASHEAQGKTHGIDYHGELSGAWLCFQPADNFYTGPMVDLNYQWVAIHGYSEKNASIGNLQFKKYHNDIFTTGLGWEAQYSFEYCCGCQTAEIVADAYLMANRQWFGHTKDIHFRQISFGENFGTWPVIVAHRNNYASAGLSLSADVRDCAIFNIGYTLNVGNLSMSEHVITVGVTAPLSF